MHIKRSLLIVHIIYCTQDHSIVNQAGCYNSVHPIGKREDQDRKTDHTM